MKKNPDSIPLMSAHQIRSLIERMKDDDRTYPEGYMEDWEAHLMAIEEEYGSD